MLAGSEILLSASNESYESVEPHRFKSVMIFLAIRLLDTALFAGANNSLAWSFPIPQALYRLTVGATSCAYFMINSSKSFASFV